MIFLCVRLACLLMSEHEQEQEQEQGGPLAPVIIEHSSCPPIPIAAFIPFPLVVYLPARLWLNRARQSRSRCMGRGEVGLGTSHLLGGCDPYAHILSILIF